MCYERWALHAVIKRQFFYIYEPQPRGCGSRLWLSPKVHIKCLIRQPDVVGRLKLYCCPFFVNAFFSDVAQTASIKSIREVRS